MLINQIPDGETEFYINELDEIERCFGVTDMAIYLPTQKKGYSKDSPSFSLRVPLNDVHSVSLKKSRPYLLWLLSLILVTVGLFTSISMFLPSIADPGQKISGYPFAIVVVGVLLPWIARNRQELTVKLTTKTRKWKTPLNVDSASRNRANMTFQKFSNGCVKAGILVKDEISA